jgi:plasmid stabilization system protein ParE
VRIELHPAARRELLLAFDNYLEQAGARVAARFLEDAERLQALLISHPQIGEQQPGGVRRIVFPRFPFTLVYRIRPGRIEVLAFAHQRLRPGYWARRGG